MSVTITNGSTISDVIATLWLSFKGCLKLNINA